MQRAARTFAVFLSALAGCAHVIHDAREAGVQRPVASCASPEPAQIPEVTRGEKSGLVFVQFTVEADGSISDLKPGPFDREADPVLFAAARDYVKQCKWKPGTQAGKPVAVHVSRGFGFYPPYLVDHAPPAPVEWTDALAAQLSAPKIIHCQPDDPRFWDGLNDGRISVVVQRDGHAGEATFGGEAVLGEDIAGYELAAIWLRSCRFQPAMTRAKDPVAVRVPLPFLFHDELSQTPSDTSLPLADGANIPIPQPTSDCDLHPWPALAEDTDMEHRLDRMKPSSAIEVEYSVDQNGNASDVLLRSTARRDVFHAVRRYLLGCHFMAVHDEGGVPLAVRVRRRFQLQLATHKVPLDKRGERSIDERVIEGDAP